MNTTFNAEDDAKIISDWNFVFGTDRYIFTKDELCDAYGIIDFGYSPRAQKFWCEPTDLDEKTQFEEMLSYCDIKNLSFKGPYFIVREDWPQEQIQSFKHWYDRCSPINIDLLADFSCYPDETKDNPELQEQAKQIALFYQSLKTILAYENHTI